MNFRRATIEDLDKVMGLRWEFQTSEALEDYDRGDFEANFEAYYREALGKTLEVFVVEDDGDLHGTVFLTRIRKVPKPQKHFSEIAYVAGVYIRPHLRNQGVGTQLFQKTIDWTRDQGIELIHLWPSALSKSYYKRMGFQSDNDIVELDLEG